MLPSTGLRATGIVAVLAAAWLGLPSLPVSAQIASGLLFEPYETFDVGSWPNSVTIGDLNADGLNDVAMATNFYFDPENDYKIFVFFQGKDGRLSAPLKLDSAGERENYYHVTSLDVGDLNGDGKGDLVRATAHGIEVHYQAPDGFKPVEVIPTEHWVGQVIVEDMDGDGDQDLVATGGIGTVIFRRTPSGWTSSKFAASHIEIEVGDITHDGLLDVVGFYWNRLYVFPQLPDGSFGPRIEYTISRGIVHALGLEVADISGDGLLDAMVSYPGNFRGPRLKVFYGLAGGVLIGPFEYASDGMPQPVEALDMNGDGRHDVVVAHGSGRRVGAYPQQPTGLLGEEEILPVRSGSHWPHDLALGDVSGDGKPDVVLVDYWFGLIVLRQKA